MPVGGGGAWPGFDTTRRATSATTAPPVWRVPEEFVGLAVVLVGGGGAWPGFEMTRRATSATTVPLVWRVPEELVGLAAVPVGGGGAWPGFETTRRAEGSWRGRRAGGPPPTGTHSSPEHPWGTHSSPAPRAHEKQQGPEAPQRLGPHTHVRQLLTG